MIRRLISKILRDKKGANGERGVALLIVLSSLMLLSALVVEFAYNANVTYNVALNERDRMQAYYLALSGLNFSKIVIKYDKEAKKMVAQASQQLGKSLKVQPLYKMMPINSALLRGMMQGSLGEGGEGAKPPAEGKEGEQKNEQVGQVLSSINTGAAKSFLDFEGDFNAQVDPEDGKVPINAFYSLSTTSPDYDRLKNILIFLFLQKPFEGLFKDKVKDSKELAGRIADYVDKNDVINDLGGGERGTETSVYTGTKNKPKNAKLLTVDELMLVPGMTDDILTELKKHVTVYKSDSKINACSATDEVVRAMILAFTQDRTDIEPLRPENEDRLKNAVLKIQENCPDVNAMSQALNDALGVTGSSSPSGSSTSQPAGSQPSGGVGGGSSSGFASMITSDEGVYRIEATGTVGNAEVKIINILNASNSNPDNWTNLYWRVE